MKPFMLNMSEVTGVQNFQLIPEYLSQQSKNHTPLNKDRAQRAGDKDLSPPPAPFDSTPKDEVKDISQD